MNFSQAHSDYLDPGDNAPNQKIDELLREDRTIKGYGRRQHGMSGKDADLDSYQVVVEQLTTEDPVKAASMRIRIDLNYYADVCEPDCDEMNEEQTRQAMDVATEIVCGETRWSGEWTGSDYWCFSFNKSFFAPLSVDEYEEIEAGNEATINLVRARIAECIYKGDEETKAFAESMGELRKAINRISP